jgi:hypothetical protein
MVRYPWMRPMLHGQPGILVFEQVFQPGGQSTASKRNATLGRQPQRRRIFGISPAPVLLKSSANFHFLALFPRPLGTDELRPPRKLL